MGWEIDDVMGYSKLRFLRFLYFEFYGDVFTTRDVLERLRRYGIPVAEPDKPRIALLLNLLNRGRYIHARRIDGHRKAYWLSKWGVYKLRTWGLI